MENILRQAKLLEEKQSWVVKGYQDFMTAINNKFTKLESVEYNRGFHIRKIEDQWYGTDIRLHVDLESTSAFTIQIWSEKNQEWTALKNPSIETIRIFCNKLTEIIPEIKEELENKTQECERVAYTFAALIDTLNRD